MEIPCEYPQVSVQSMLALKASLETSKDILTENLAGLQENENLADIQIICNGVTIKCHKFILAARSDVFKAMLCQDKFKEGQNNEIEIVDSRPESVQQMVNFLYRDDCEDMEKHVWSLLPLAEKYNIPRLKLKCELWLAANISVANAAKILHLADLHNSADLFGVAQNFVMNEMDRVKHTQNWKILKDKHPAIVFKMVETMNIPHNDYFDAPEQTKKNLGSTSKESKNCTIS